MLRNRELLFFACCAGVVTVVSAVLCGFSQIPAVLVCVSACLAVCALCIIYSIRRYRSIARLNAYLRKLAHGERALDIRDNAEGELSILKNEIYKVTAALTQQQDTLSKDKRALARALADISHQLKTPLTEVSLMADLLDSDALSPEKRREFADNMRFSLNRMEWLVLTLLKLARLDVDTADLKQEPVKLSTLTSRSCRMLAIPIELREQRLLATGQDTDIICDPDWTSEALANILKNAARHTPRGGLIKISYGSNPLYAFIEVRDGGLGIDKADMPHLFKRFYQGKNAGPGSVGIGLAMSLAVMRKQGGDIEAQNDGGGVFTLKFYKTIC